MDPDIAGKRVDEHSTQLLSWHWAGDDESIVPMITSFVAATILSIVNATIAGLPDRSGTIPELWGCRQVPNGDGCPQARNVTPIFVNNTSAGWVQVVMKLINPTHFYVVYHGQHANGTSGAQMRMLGGHSYLPLDEILPPPAENMIDNIKEE